MTTLALVGGQYGSEGKGVIAAGLAPMFDAAVRTGGPNAGHSFFYHQNLYKMRQVPCAWVNGKARLFLGAGAVVDPDLLCAELGRTGATVTIDPQATLILPHHHEAETNENLRGLIGSTTEGVGAARISKIKRNGDALLAREFDWDLHPHGDRVLVEEVAPALEEIYETGGLIMLEGTQGSGLSLHHGRYPYTTSADTNAAQLAADAGLPPSRVEHTHLVVRTHPIRVAGNSGPTGGLELSWDDLRERGVVDLPERTTVTNNIRRIFTFDDEDFRRAARLNDPCGIWVTFGDYLTPAAKGIRDIDDLMELPEVRTWVQEHIFRAGHRLLGIGVGGQFWDVAQTGDTCHRPGTWHTDLPWELANLNEEAA